MEQIFKTADLYIESLFQNNDEGLSAAAQIIKATQIPDMSISANQGRFLHVLARGCRASRILEIGTFLGYSTIWLAKALDKDGQLVSIENDETHAAIAQKNITNAGLGGMVTIRKGNALDILPQIELEGNGPFDMIFIDADKPSYSEYFQWALRLARPGTLIVADNVIRHVYDIDSTVEKKEGVVRFNNLLAASTAVTATIIQDVGVKGHDGMAIAVVN